MTTPKTLSIILNQLIESLESGDKGYVNLSSELEGKISFKELRAAVYHLSEIEYITHNDEIPDNKGFHCKITKEGIKYHENLLEAKNKSEEKKSLKHKVSGIIHFFEHAYTIVIVVVAVGTLAFSVNLRNVFEKAPFAASLLGIEIEHKEITEEIDKENENNGVDKEFIRSAVEGLEETIYKKHALGIVNRN